MRFASLGSGSRGNGTVVQAGDTLLLVDCGFSLRETEARLSRLGVQSSALKAILVTHEHGDHCQGVRVLANRYDLPVYMTAGTARSPALTEVKQRRLVAAEEVFVVGNVSVQPVPVPHDAAEPVQFIFSCAEKRLGVLTDLGSITSHVRQQYRHCDALVLESNHCVDMLARSSYPSSLKLRVGGHFGHLNNHQAADLLHDVERARLQHLVIAHMSEKNNSIERAQAALQHVVTGLRNVLYACQDDGFDWLTIT